MKIDTLERICNGWLLLIGLCFVVNGCVHLLDIQFPFPLWDESTDILAFAGGIFMLGIVATQPKLAKILWDERYNDKSKTAASVTYFLLLVFFTVLLLFNKQDGLIPSGQIAGVLILSVGVQLLYVAVSEFMGK